MAIEIYLLGSLWINLTARLDASSYDLQLESKVEECKELSFDALIYPYGVVLFNIFLPYANSFEL